MSLVKWTFIGLIALPAAELLAFVMVASLIGWLRTAALFIATSVVGVLVLRKSGRADLARFRAAFAQQGLRAVHLETPGVATMLGGILLTFPGFITDILGNDQVQYRLQLYFQQVCDCCYIPEVEFIYPFH